MTTRRVDQSFYMRQDLPRECPTGGSIETVTIVLADTQHTRLPSALEMLLSYACVHAIVVSCSMKAPQPTIQDPRIHYRYKDDYLAQKYGIGISYIAALDPRIETAAVCFIDELNKLPSEVDLNILHTKWRARPQSIHGVNGHSIFFSPRSKTYMYDATRAYGPVFTVDRHCSIMTRSLLYRALTHISNTPWIYNFLRTSTPRWHSSDLTISFLSRHLTGYHNIVHSLSPALLSERIVLPSVQASACVLGLLQNFMHHRRIVAKSSPCIVLIPYYNYANSIRIYTNLVECVNGLQAQGADVLVCEIRLPDQISHIQTLPCSIISITSPTIAFHNHTCFNIGFEAIADHYDYIIQCDSDILFDDPEWVRNVTKCLETCDMVQPWSTALWLNNRREPMRARISFSSFYTANPTMQPDTLFSKHIGDLHHAGFAWAFRTDFLKRTGGLFNRGFLGSGDTTISYTALGPRIFTLSPDNPLKKLLVYLSPDLDMYLTRATSEAVRVGSMEGVIRHLVHGKLANRQYLSRHVENLREGTTIYDFLEPGGPCDPVIFLDNTKNERMLTYFKNRKDDEVD